MNQKRQQTINSIVGIISIIGFALILYTLPEVMDRIFYHPIRESMGYWAPISYAIIVVVAYGFVIFTIFFTIILNKKPIEQLRTRNKSIQIINEGKKIVQYTSIIMIPVLSIFLVNPYGAPIDWELRMFPYYLSPVQSNIINYLGMFIILVASRFYKEYHVALPYSKKDKKGNYVVVGVWKCPSCGESNSDTRKKCFYCGNVKGIK